LPCSRTCPFQKYHFAKISAPKKMLFFKSKNLKAPLALRPADACVRLVKHKYQFFFCYEKSLESNATYKNIHVLAHGGGLQK